jgi:hypothetical protein
MEELDYDLEEGKKYEHGIGKVNSAFEIGTPEYRQHTQSITPGQEITDYQRFKVESMKEALAKVWGLEEGELPPALQKSIDAKKGKDKDKDEKKEDKDLTKLSKNGKVATGAEADEINLKPKIKD